MKSRIQRFLEQIQKTYWNKYHIIFATSIAYYIWLISPALMVGRMIAIKPIFEIKYIFYTILLIIPIIIGLLLFIFLQKQWLKIFILHFFRFLIVGEIFLNFVPDWRGARFFPITQPHPYFGSTSTETSERYRQTIPKKKEGEYRIILYGGSSVWGGKTSNDSFSYHLEKHFNEKGYKKVKVYNLGVVGSVARQQLHFLFEDISIMDPDLVVFYNGGNGAMQPVFWDPRPGYPPDFFIFESGADLLKGEKSFLMIGSLLLMKSKVLDLIPHFKEYVLGYRLTKIKNIRSKLSAGTDEWRSNISLDYVDAMKKAYKLGQNYGFDVAIFLQPLLNFKIEMHSNEEALGFHYANEHLEKIYNTINSLMNTISKKNKDLAFFDLRHIFNDIPDQVFLDHIHINDSFRPVVSEILFDNINSIVKKDYKSK